MTSTGTQSNSQPKSKKQLSNQERQEIINLYLQNMKISQIAKLLSKPPTTVSQIIQIFVCEKRITAKKRGGTSKKLNPDQILFVLKLRAKGMKIREISAHLAKFYNIFIGKSQIGEICKQKKEDNEQCVQINFDQEFADFNCQIGIDEEWLE